MKLVNNREGGLFVSAKKTKTLERRENVIRKNPTSTGKAYQGVYNNNNCNITRSTRTQAHRRPAKCTNTTIIIIVVRCEPRKEDNDLTIFPRIACIH